MQRIISYIEFLITQHDCVTIPGFGAFIMQHQSAYWADEHTLMPPMRVVAFNSALQYNDGLLVSLVALDRGLSYDQALIVVTDFVDQLKSILHTEESVCFGTIGVFQYRVGEGLQFDIPNQLDTRASSEGLGVIEINPFEGEVKEVDILVIEEESSIQVLTPKYSFSILKRFAAVVVLVLGFSFLAQHRSDNKPVSHQASMVQLPQPMKSQIIDLHNKLDIPEAVEIVKESAVQELEVKPVEIVKAKPQRVKKYFIVVSSFPSQSKAIEAMGRLQKQGLDTIDYLEKDSRYRLYVASFYQKQEAEQYLGGFKTENPRYKDAWLLASWVTETK